MAFTCFLRLPKELRLAIWRECLPHRVVELDYHIDDFTWEQTRCKNSWNVTTVNKAPPKITRVCRESRAVAHEHGQRILAPESSRDDFLEWMVGKRWFDPSRDSIHLNWEPSSDIDWYPYNYAHPIHYLLAQVAGSRPRRASIMLGMLLTPEFRQCPEEPDPECRWTKTEFADLMRIREIWTVVILDPVMIHADLASVGNQFGLLGDARVQVVDASDEARITELLDLEKKPNVTIGLGFTLPALVEGKQKLRDAVNVIFGSEKDAPVMRPAVLFRLCTRKCAR